MKKISLVLLVMVMMVIVVLPVQASTVMPRYTYVDSLFVRLDIDTILGVATCEGSITAKGMYPVEVIVNLQRYENGQWVTIRRWTKEDTMNAKVYKEYGIYRGYNYRAYVQGFVYDEDGYFMETASASQSKGFN